MMLTVGFPFFLAWAVGIPLFSLWKLKTNIKKLLDDSANAKGKKHE